MSQEKVDRYKEEKANRKAIMAQQKKKRAIRNAVAGLVAVVFIGWIGYSGYVSMTEPSGETTQVDYTSIMEYINGLTKTE